MRRQTLAWAALILGCGAQGGAGHAREPNAQVAAATTPEAPMPPRDAQEGTAPRGMLSVEDARKYMVQLINLDRASMGLPPVELDDAAPTRAAQRHAQDMASHGFLGHWGTDGSVPEQRLTEAGGADMVLENASCFIDEKPRTLDRAPLIDPRNVEKAEEMFFHEAPPHDGHRQNILKTFHKRVGIGIAQPIATATEIPVPCFSQEFIDPYAEYAPVPRRVRVGDTVHVEGTMLAPATIGGIGVARAERPHKLAVEDANKRRSYPVPQPFQMYWPPGYKTPIPVKVSGASFSIDLPISDAERPGMYELSVWARFPGSTEFVMVGLRTIQVGER